MALPVNLSGALRLDHLWRELMEGDEADVMGANNCAAEIGHDQQMSRQMTNPRTSLPYLQCHLFKAYSQLTDSFEKGAGARFGLA